METILNVNMVILLHSFFVGCLVYGGKVYWEKGRNTFKWNWNIPISIFLWMTSLRQIISALLTNWNFYVHLSFWNACTLIFHPRMKIAEDIEKDIGWWWAYWSLLGGVLLLDMIHSFFLSISFKWCSTPKRPTTFFKDIIAWMCGTFAALHLIYMIGNFFLSIQKVCR